MKIEIVKVGYLQTNCYILSKDDNVLVIDPGDECEKIEEVIAGRKVNGIIITHHHFDHVGALSELEKSTGAAMYDISNLEKGQNEIGDFQFECILTPGHKEDSISIYFEKENNLFCGDFIFEGTIGRWDLAGGSPKDMIESITNILSYPDDMTIYPGHGESTSLGKERQMLENYKKHF